MTLISRYHMFGPQHFANIHVIRAFLDIKKNNKYSLVKSKSELQLN